MKKTFVVTQELTRYQTVELDIPDDLLIDGEVPDFLLDSEKTDAYDEWVTEHVYRQADTNGMWITKTHESNWDEENDND